MTSPYTTAGGAKSNDPTPPNTAVHRAVDRLVAELNDGVRGFEAAAEATEDDLETMFEKMADKRRTRIANLKTMADGRGIEAERLDSDGTVGGKLRTAWMGLKDAAVGERGVIGSAIEGEQRLRDQLNELIDGDLVDPFIKVARNTIADIEENLAELGKAKASN